MRTKIDHILIGMLWVLAVLLGTSFWFNTHYGFNMFSAAHWQYLAYLQAAQIPVRTSFYVSLALSVFIMIFGLYMLLRPRLRKLIPSRKNLGITVEKPKPPVQNTTPQNTDASVIVATPTENVQTPSHMRPASPATSQRPPRLNMPVNFNPAPTATPAPTSGQTFVTSTPTNTAQDYPEIREIFTSAGYTIKKNPKIGDVTPTLLAIGTNETLWIGAVGIETTRLRRAMDKMSQVFSDTLDDIYINMNGFVIGAPDAATSEFQDILMFDSVAALRDYMASHPNPPIPADDEGNFDAYSAYISTVIDYIGKI